MKQILQNARSGDLELAEVPAPLPARGQLLVQNHYSVVSPGTDKTAMGFAQMSMLGKARSRPDLARQVIEKLRQEGPASTYRTVMSRLDVPQALGYSSAGVVRAVGDGVKGFQVGDRVACAGAGYANHAELVVVPSNLAALVPDGVSLEAAAYSTLGAIAMQGLRVANPTIGEIAAVVGLGLVGQITVQLLRANGCRVLGLDLDPKRIASSLQQGAEWASTPGDLGDAWIATQTNGVGVDFAIVTAASNTSAPLELAARLCRKKGRISFVGATPIELDRRLMFEKELDLRMSTSYGPGRYDRKYEEEGLDYPIAYVRWTENRNLQAFLAADQLGVDRSAAVSIRSAPLQRGGRGLRGSRGPQFTSLAVVFEYASEVDATRSLEFTPRRTAAEGIVGVSFLGAGNYSKAVLLPVPQECRRSIGSTLVTATGPLRDSGADHDSSSAAAAPSPRRSSRIRTSTSCSSRRATTRTSSTASRRSRTRRACGSRSRRRSTRRNSTGFSTQCEPTMGFWRSDTTDDSQRIRARFSKCSRHGRGRSRSTTAWSPRRLRRTAG